MNIVTVPKKTIFIYKIRLTILLITLAAIAAIFCIFSFWFLCLTGLFLILIPIVLFIFSKHLKSYEIIDNGRLLIIKRGFLIKAEYVVPKENMTAAIFFSLPLSRKYKLSGILLRSPGLFLIIPEINFSDAERIAGKS